MHRTEKLLLVVGVLALSTLVFFFSFRKIYAPDYFWHAEYGRYVLDKGIPETDEFSFTAEGERVIDLSWLAQVLMFVSGETGTIVLRSVVFVVAFILSFFLLPLKTPLFRLVLLALLVLGVVAASSRYICRPAIFTDLLFVLFVFLLLRLRGWRLLFLVPLVVLWVNLHNGFLMAPTLVVSALLAVPFGRLIGAECETERRPLFLLLLLCATILATLINPYFIEGALYPFSFFGKTAGYAPVLEWQSPLRELTDFVSGRLLSYKLLLVLLIVSTIASHHSWRPFRLLLSALVVFLSLLAYRNVSLFALIAPPVIAANAEDAFERINIPETVRKFCGYAVVAVVLLASLTLSVLCATNGFWRSRRLYDISFGTGVSCVTFPMELPEFLAKETDIKRIFHNYELGGFLLARCGRKTFLDGRLVHFPQKVHDDYWMVMREPVRADTVLHDYAIDAVLLEHHRGRFDRLIRHFYRNRLWRLVYIDTVVVMFRREDAPSVADEKSILVEFVMRLKRGEYPCGSYPEYAEESLRRLLYLLGEEDLAGRL